MYSDPIADLLIRIKNATKARKSEVVFKNSKLKINFLQILKNEGYISDFAVSEIKKGTQSEVTVFLKYKWRTSSIAGVRQISKPGLRIYSQAHKLPRVLNGLGIAIISTSKGLMSDKQARQAQLGGEVLAYIW